MIKRREGLYKCSNTWTSITQGMMHCDSEPQDLAYNLLWSISKFFTFYTSVLPSEKQNSFCLIQKSESWATICETWEYKHME